MLETGEWRQGWRIVLAALFGIAFGVTGLFFYSTGLFLKPVASEFGWSRATASSVNLVAALTLGATAPFVGRLVDRFGARRVALASCVGLAIGFVLLSRSPPSLAIYLGLVALTVLLGAGAAPVAYTRLINVWFQRARGTALGFAQTATGVAAALLPPLLVPYIASHGWRAGYLVLGAATLVSAPVVLVLLGRPNTPPASQEASRALPDGIRFAVAVRTPVFRVLAGLLIFAAIGLSGIIVHIVPLLSDAGLPPRRASAIAGLLGVGIIVGRALTGILVDRVFAPRVAFGAFAAAATGCGLLAWGGPDWAIPATVLTGFAMGAEIDLISYFVARYFGLAHYGSIYGGLYAVFMVGTSIGPVIAGACFDHFGNYRVATATLGTALLIAALLAWGLPAFKTRVPDPA